MKFKIICECYARKEECKRKFRCIENEKICPCLVVERVDEEPNA